jgi:hypothetical protein
MFKIGTTAMIMYHLTGPVSYFRGVNDCGWKNKVVLNQSPMLSQRLINVDTCGKLSFS